MQSADQILSLRYAKALFSAAQEQGVPDVRGELSVARDCLREFSPWLENPFTSLESKRATLEKALGSRTPRLVARFFDLLVERKRLGLLPLILSDLERLAAEKENSGRAQVVSAVPLSSVEKEKLQERLEKFFSKKIELEVKEDPEILGGVSVRLGDWVLDASLKHQLKALREVLDGN